MIPPWRGVSIKRQRDSHNELFTCGEGGIADLKPVGLYNPHRWTTDRYPTQAGNDKGGLQNNLNEVEK